MIVNIYCSRVVDDFPFLFHHVAKDTIRHINSGKNVTMSVKAFLDILPDIT